MEKYSVVMSNDLIRKTVPVNENDTTLMTVMENRIRTMLISKIEFDAQKFNWLDIGISEFAEFWYLQSWGGVQNEMLKDAINKLKYTQFSVDGKIYVWLDGESYFESGNLHLKLDNSLSQFLIGLTSKFTKFDIENILNLNSKYSFQLYTIMKSVEFMGGYRITLPKAYEIFCDDKYRTKSELEYHVLIPAIENINQYTDIRIEYEFKKSFGQSEMLYLTVINYDDYFDKKEKDIQYFTVLGGKTKNAIPQNTTISNAIETRDNKYVLEDCESVTDTTLSDILYRIIEEYHEDDLDFAF